MECHRRVLFEQPGPVEALEPVLELRDAAGLVDPGGDRREDLGRSVAVAGCEGVLECGLVVSRRREPVGGAGVEDRNELGLVLGELALEKLPEEVVVAVRLAPAVERNRGRGSRARSWRAARPTPRRRALRRRGGRTSDRGPTCGGGSAEARAGGDPGTPCGSSPRRNGRLRAAARARRSAPRRLGSRAPRGRARPASPRTARSAAPPAPRSTARPSRGGASEPPACSARGRPRRTRPAVRRRGAAQAGASGPRARRQPASSPPPRRRSALRPSPARHVSGEG